MDNGLVCPSCKGSQSVSFRYELVDLGDGLTDWYLFPNGPKDWELIGKVFGEIPGRRLMWQKVSRRTGEVERPAVRIWQEKVEETPALKQTIDLMAKTKPELIEMAVRAGVTDANDTWSKAKLVASIEKAPVTS